VKLSFDKKKHYRKASTILLGAGVTLFVLVLYLRTLAPTVLYLDAPLLLDAAMLQMQVCVLGITHPTGYPSYLMLSHLFTYLPFGDCAYRVNLASAAYAALTVSAVYAAGLLLSRRPVVAAVGALAFGLGTTFWSQAVIAEVYTLNALSVALALGCLLLWHERRSDRYLLLCAFLVGFSMTNHLTSGLLLPASLLFVAIVDWRKLVDTKLVLKGVGLFLLGLMPYLYLPIRASMDPPMDANNPTTLGRFWYVVSGGNLRDSFLAFGPAELPHRLALYGEHLIDNFHPLFVMVGFTGAGVLLIRDRAVAALTGFLFLGWLFYAIENNIVDNELSFIPTYLVLALWVAIGFGALLDAVASATVRFSRVLRAALPGVLSVALLLLPLLGIGAAYAKNDTSEDYKGRQIIEAVADNAKPNATILHQRSGLWYLVLVEKRRRDLTLVDPFYHNKNIRYADIVWPDDIDLPTTDRRYGTDDFTGVTAAKKAAEDGPVYLLAEGKANPQDFRNAGFRTAWIEKGVLCELIPPGD
jgi:hypothetical protein